MYSSSAAAGPPLLHGDLDLTIHEARGLPNMDVLSTLLRRLCLCPPAARMMAPRPSHSVPDGESAHHHRRRRRKRQPHGHRVLPTSDPYAAVVVPGPPAAMLARTYVFCNSEAPRWEARFLLPLAHRAARLDFHVRDVNPLGSDLIGTASLPVAAVPRDRAAAARTRRAHRPLRAELAGCRCLLAPPARAKLAGRRLPARAAAAPSGPAPPHVDLAGEAPSTFQISISNIPFFQFQHLVFTVPTF